MDDNGKPAKRRNKFAGKEDVSRETADHILFGQIDRMREISRINNETTTKVRESVGNSVRKAHPDRYRAIRAVEPLFHP